MDLNSNKLFTIEAYEALFMTHYPALIRSAYRLLGDPAASEDIVQDVFCKLWEKKNDLYHITSLKSYLFRMVINESLNHINKNKAIHAREDSYSAFLDVADNSTTNRLNVKELEKKVENTVRGLPPVCRKVFILSRYEQFSYNQIATELNISVKAVEKHITKALKALRDILIWLIFLKLFF